MLTSDVTNMLMKAFKQSLKELHNDFLQHITDWGPLGDVTPSKRVYKLFIQSLEDLSLNERTIHYGESSDVVYDDLYILFEKVLVNEAAVFTKRLLETAYKK